MGFLLLAGLFRRDLFRFIRDHISKSNKKLFYQSIVTSPSTSEVTASFGVLEDIIIAKSNAYIAFVDKRVTE